MNHQKKTPKLQKKKRRPRNGLRCARLCEDMTYNIYVHTCITSIRWCVFMYVYIYMSLHIYIDINMCICIHINMCIPLYAYIYIYIYTVYIHIYCIYTYIQYMSPHIHALFDSGKFNQTLGFPLFSSFDNRFIMFPLPGSVDGWIFSYPPKK